MDQIRGWCIPAFPTFISIDEFSGEIIAAPQAEYSSTTHAIIASNSGGVSTTNLTISVINIQPMFSYPSPQWTFVLGYYDELPLPLIGDMSIDNWDITPGTSTGFVNRFKWTYRWNSDHIRQHKP